MISVIIPLYNKAPYIEKAIRSVFAQTYTDWELIVIDDGSTDNSVSVVEMMHCIVSSDKVRLIQQKNAGVSTTRNRGVEMTQGEYICFLDADDWWNEYFLEEISKAIVAYPDAGIIATNYWYVKNGRQRVCVQNMQDGYMDYIAAYLHQMKVGGGMPLWTGAVCVRKDVFLAIGGFNPQLRLGEDFDLWIRIAHDYKVAFVDKPLAFYNQDVEVAKRATRHLHNPAVTELSQYDAYLQLYNHSAAIQQLISKKRAVAWIPYLQSKQYREQAKQELQKVDWSNEGKKAYCYRPHSLLPIFILKAWVRIKQFLSCRKSWLIKRLNKYYIRYEQIH